MNARNLEELRKKHEALVSNQGGGNSNSNDKYLYVEANSEAVVRVLPGKNHGEEDELPFYRESMLHRIPKDFSADRSPTDNYHCPRAQGDSCPICDTYFALYKTEVESDKALAKKIKPAKLFLMNVFDRSDKKTKIFSTGITVFTTFLTGVLNVEDFGDVLSPTEGHDFKIVKSQKGKDWPDYSQSMIRPKGTPLGTDKEIAEIMADAHDLDELISLKPYDELKRVAQEVELRSSMGGVYTSELKTPTSEGADREEFTKSLKG